MKYETKILSTRYPRPDAYGSLAMPVYHTAAFEFPSAKAMSDAFCGRSAAPSYSRIANPTVSHLEERVRQWTGALSVTALNTGMAAVAYALTAVSAAGLNIVASRHLFGNSLSLLRDTLGTLGVEARFADFTCPDEVAALIDDNTAALFFEVITNPQLLVADIRALADVAHSHGVPLIADTTIVPFTVFHARDFGIDIEVISSTKYISGGGTGLGGLLIDYGTIDWSSHPSPQMQSRIRRVGRKMPFTARVKTELVTNLGGLKYKYEVCPSKGIPADGSDITLMPQLPEGAEDSGQWQWSTGETTPSITTAYANTYSVTGTDVHGCSSTANKTVTIWQVSAQIVGSRSFCQGGHTTLSVTGNEAYTYHWNDGSTANSLDIYTPGTYSVSVTNSLGCTNTISANVSENAAPTPSITGTTTICQGRTAIYVGHPDWHLFCHGHQRPRLLSLHFGDRHRQPATRGNHQLVDRHLQRPAGLLVCAIRNGYPVQLAYERTARPAHHRISLFYQLIHRDGDG